MRNTAVTYHIEKKDTSNKTNLYLQYLRAISCVGVVVFHATLLSNYTYSEGYVFTIGKYFVGIFFVLSGYLVERNCKDNSFNKAKFLRRRFNRVYPLYLIFTLLAALSYFIKYGNIDIGNLLKSVALHSRLSNSTPVLYVGWSVEIECLFYVLFAFISSSPMLLLALGWAGSIIFNEIVGTAFLQILCGIMLCKICKRDKFFWKLLFIINITMIYMLGEDEEMLVTIFSVIYIVASTNAPIAHKSEILSVIGDASFSIYLIQAFTLPVCMMLWKFLDSGQDIYNVVSTAITILIGVAIFKYVELPILRRIN